MGAEGWRGAKERGPKPRKSGGPRGMEPTGVGTQSPKGGVAQNFALVFPLPLPFSLFFFSLGEGREERSSRGIVATGRAHGPPKWCIWAPLGRPPVAKFVARQHDANGSERLGSNRFRPARLTCLGQVPLLANPLWASLTCLGPC